MGAALLLFWHSLSALGLGLSFGGVTLAVCVLLALKILPGVVSRTLVALAILLVFCGGLYQWAYASATHAEEVRRVQAELAIERSQRKVAEAISRKDRERAERAAAEQSNAAARLKKLEDDLAKDPSRNHVCVDGSTARRLRDL